MYPLAAPGGAFRQVCIIVGSARLPGEFKDLASNIQDRDPCPMADCSHALDRAPTVRKFPKAGACAVVGDTRAETSTPPTRPGTSENLTQPDSESSDTSHPLATVSAIVSG